MKKLTKPKTLMIGAFLVGTFFQNQLLAQCNCSGSYFIENYTNNAGWTNVNKATNLIDGTMNIGGGACTFNQVTGNVEVRSYLPLPSTGLDNNTWTADFIFELTGNNSKAPGHYLAAFTAGTTDPLQTSCTNTQQWTGANFQCQTYTTTNQDGIWVELESPEPTQTSLDPYAKGDWAFYAVSKKGTTSTRSSDSILYPKNGAPGTKYYIRLQRTWSSQGVLSVFSDPGRTHHIPGSPICFSIDPTISNLNYLQHGVIPTGSYYRLLQANVDSMKICNNIPCPFTLNPTFTINPVFCLGSTITANATASSGTPMPPTSYEWMITQCDQNGNAYWNPSTTWSQWYTGSPGVFTFPSAGAGGPSFLQCGNYYLVALALSNCGNQYQPTGQKIYIDCPPKITVSSSTNACVGQPVTFTAQGATSYNWSPSSNLSASTGSVVSATVASVTTVYSVTGADSYGCKNTATVSVVPGPNIVPKFTLTGSSTSGNPYYNVEATNYPWSPTTVPGMGLVWEVVQVVAGSNPPLPTNTVVTSVVNPYCWGPGSSTGPVGPPVWFNCYSNNTPNPFPTSASLTSPTCTCPGDPIGKFQIGSEYMITLGTWSNECPWSSTYQTVYLNCEGCKFEIKENTATKTTVEAIKESLKLTEFANTNTTTIVPNPNNGYFTIEGTTTDINSTVEIYDLNGRMLLNQKINNSMGVNASDLLPGIYNVCVKTNNTITNKKLIIVK